MKFRQIPKLGPVAKGCQDHAQPLPTGIGAQTVMATQGTQRVTRAHQGPVVVHISRLPMKQQSIISVTSQAALETRRIPPQTLRRDSIIRT